MKRGLLLLTAVLLGTAVLSAQPRILAHRGGRADQEENTLAAFKATKSCPGKIFRESFSAPENATFSYSGNTVPPHQAAACFRVIIMPPIEECIVHNA